MTEPTTAADKLRDWINGDLSFTHAEPNRWLNEALAEARANAIKERDALSVLLDYEQAEARQQDASALRERIHEAIIEANAPNGNEYDPALINDDVTDAVMAVLVALPPSAPADKTPFQRVIDDLTDGCGCACHTGIGYNAACGHCQPRTL